MTYCILIIDLRLVQFYYIGISSFLVVQVKILSSGALIFFFEVSSPSSLERRSEVCFFSLTVLS